MRRILSGLGIFVVMAVTAPAPAQNAQPERFQPLPRDESLQPLPPTGPGNIDFVGARSFNEDQLRTPLAEQIREIQAQGLTRPRADDTAYYLAVFYRKQGFADVEVDYEIRGSRLLLRIDEGPRAYLRKVTFAGNRTITSETLYQYMIGATEERLLREPAQFPFVKGDVETGVSRIRGLYEAEGFVEAHIDDAELSFTRNRTGVDVRIRIKEGPRYGFGSINFTGGTIFTRDELVKGLGEPLDQPYTTQRANTMQRNLEFFFKSRGYYAAAVQVASDPAKAVAARKTGAEGRVFTRAVPLYFTIQPGPLYRFDGVTVTGLDRLRPSFIQNRFRKLHGDVYDPARLDETYREVLRTGLFRNLRINSVPLPDNTIRIELTAEEAKAKEFGFSIGFSSYEGLIFEVRVADRNMGGNGRPISLTLENSLRGLGAELLYVDPWLFESEFALRTRLYAQGRQEEGYSKRETGFRADLTHKATKNIELGAFFQVENVEITEAAIEPIFLGLTAYQVASIGFTQSYDFRDNPLSPSRGWVINTAIDADAIANELAFGRGTARMSYYHPIGEKMLLALGMRGGIILPFTSVPIDERFFLGGGTTVRSFAERQLGPKDKQGYPIGGEAFTVFNAELDFPLRDALHGAVFVDAGNLIARFQDAGVQDIRYALGVGLRYKLPIGPVRLDVGINPTPKKDESWGAVHFSFGFAF